MRIATGRDAADVSLATIPGGVTQVYAPTDHAISIDDAAHGFVMPYHTEKAVSTANR